MNFLELFKENRELAYLYVGDENIICTLLILKRYKTISGKLKSIDFLKFLNSHEEMFSFIELIKESKVNEITALIKKTYDKDKITIHEMLGNLVIEDKTKDKDGKSAKKKRKKYINNIETKVVKTLFEVCDHIIHNESKEILLKSIKGMYMIQYIRSLEEKYKWIAIEEYNKNFNPRYSLKNLSYGIDILEDKGSIIIISCDIPFSTKFKKEVTFDTFYISPSFASEYNVNKFISAMFLSCVSAIEDISNFKIFKPDEEPIMISSKQKFINNERFRDFLVKIKNFGEYQWSIQENLNILVNGAPSLNFNLEI